jgi:hypothetical protein
MTTIPPQLPLWQTNPIQYLINDKYPLNYLQRVREVSSSSLKLDEDTVRAIAAYRLELEGKTPVELAPQVQEARTREAERSRLYLEKVEAQAFFNQPDADADFTYWARISYWTLEESVALSMGKNPKIVSSQTLKAHKGKSTFIATYSARLEEVTRAQKMGVLWEPTIPGLFVAWAERIDLVMPPELIILVKALGTHVFDWKKGYEAQLEIAKTLRAELQSAYQEILDEKRAHTDTIKKFGTDTAKLAEGYKEIIAGKEHWIEKQNSNIAAYAARLAELEGMLANAQHDPVKDVGPRERGSLLKLILGMAMKGYSYDPKATRSAETKEIADDLVLAGLPLDVDTVRKYLQEAKDLFADELNRTDDA